MSPRTPFAGHRYVSDVLEGLLDAEETRAVVRAYCIRFLDALPDPLHAQLEAAATYVGGECMGYPAIWFLERLFADELTIEEILDRCRVTLCISLTTSIVDDLADGDEPIGSAYLAYLYVLIGEAALHGRRDVRIARDRLYRALDICRESRREHTERRDRPPRKANRLVLCDDRGRGARRALAAGPRARRTLNDRPIRRNLRACR